MADLLWMLISHYVKIIRWVFGVVQEQQSSDVFQLKKSPDIDFFLDWIFFLVLGSS